MSPLDPRFGRIGIPVITPVTPRPTPATPRPADPPRPPPTERVRPRVDPRAPVVRPRAGSGVVSPPPPVAPPISPPTIPENPEPPIPRLPPANVTDSKVLGDWWCAALHAHSELRARSFWDTGDCLENLLELRAVYGAANIKELVSKARLGLSHMTANKYLQIRRTFERDLAVLHGIEKCYALVRYAKLIGRPGQGGVILANDEPIRGAGNLRALGITAAQLNRAIVKLVRQARDSKVPSETRANYERIAQQAQRIARSIGFRGADARLARFGGELQVAIYIPIQVAENLGTAIPRPMARYAARLAKTQPELFEPFREAGWRPKARTG